ncbi:erythromycin esterase family protein [Marinobacter daqiaonensis]|nr:erythromycin esterase family protein [Marinobacter daqiaonensis]
MDTDTISDHIAAVSIPFESATSLPLEGILERIGDARVVLIGEASHGTSEFYVARERITRALIEQKGFSFVSAEADWPDASRVDHYVRHAEYPPGEWTAFARFPTWMWRNQETLDFVEWLRRHNAELDFDDRVAFHGLDLYSLFSSINEVLSYLDQVDPETAAIARQRYECLAPYRHEPVEYARAALSPRFQDCEPDVLRMLSELYERRAKLEAKDGTRFFNAMQNARLIANAEEYYRTMLFGTHSGWNLRDTHMFETLESLLEHYGENSRGVVWAHNSHIGNSAATDMSRRGEFNIGQLCREKFGSKMYSIGFGTDNGTVAAADDWGDPVDIKQVRPSREDSYEYLCHRSGVPNFTLPLRGGDPSLVKALEKPRLERAIGVIYRPLTERQSHYFGASLPRQFDEYIWFDTSQAVSPLGTQPVDGVPDTYPFGV